MNLSTVKQLTISLGLYRPARALHSLIHRNGEMRDHKFLLAEFIKRSDLAFDVGANIGARTELMLSLGARVVAFEPQPICAREVRARGGKRLTVVDSAVGSTVGAAKLFLTSATALASLKPDWQRCEERGIITVPVTTLDVEIAKYGMPAFCKIDVEGFEIEVLKGLSSPISALSLEYHCDERGVAKITECLNLLSKLGAYEFNLTGSEEAKWLLDHWTTAPDFLAAFPACALPHFYGDIFARRKR
jgi:FkbM family methyltransferase